jgi:hypothetical protein
MSDTELLESGRVAIVVAPRASDAATAIIIFRIESLLKIEFAHCLSCREADAASQDETCRGADAASQDETCGGADAASQDETCGGADAASQDETCRGADAASPDETWGQRGLFAGLLLNLKFRENAIWNETSVFDRRE